MTAAVKMTTKTSAVVTNHQVKTNLNTPPASMLVVDMATGKMGELLTIQHSPVS
jgi:hypothetical protein